MALRHLVFKAVRGQADHQLKGRIFCRSQSDRRQAPDKTKAVPVGSHLKKNTSQVPALIRGPRTPDRERGGARGVAAAGQHPLSRPRGQNPDLHGHRGMATKSSERVCIHAEPAMPRKQLLKGPRGLTRGSGLK